MTYHHLVRVPVMDFSMIGTEEGRIAIIHHWKAKCVYISEIYDSNVHCPAKVLKNDLFYMYPKKRANAAHK